MNRAAFNQTGGMTIGLEEEVLLLDRESLRPAPVAAELLGRLGDPDRFKPELPAAQLEIVTRPQTTVAAAVAELAQGRAQLLASADGVVPAALAVHPFAAPFCELSQGRRYERLQETYGPIARLQLVASLHIHVGVGGGERSVAVYNELRSYLPEIMALAASAPFHAGSDSGFATVRPKIADLLPRQGVPPAFRSLADYEAALDWLIASGAAPDPTWWWYELRLHPTLGTIEVRVADVQARLSDAAALAALVQALAARSADRFDAGEQRDPAPRERIEANRFSASRYGVEGMLADLETGVALPARERLEQLIGELAPAAERRDCAEQLRQASKLSAENGAMRMRSLAAESSDGLRGLTRVLADEFAAGLSEVASGYS